MKKIILFKYYIFFLFIPVMAQNPSKYEVQVVFPLPALPKAEKNDVIKRFKDTENPVVEGKGHAEMLIDKNTSEIAAQEKTLQLAREDALEKLFGRSIVNNNAIRITNETNSKDDVKTKTVFTSNSNSVVNGQWLADCEGECKIVSDGKSRFCFYDITILARRIVDAGVQFKAKTLNGSDSRKNRTTEFVDGASLMLYFNSPSAGYLSVFLVDPENASCLLPYKTQSGLFKVEANKEYLLFADTKEQQKPEYVIDEYSLSTNKEMEQNQLYVIFSEEMFTNPVTYNPSQQDKEAQLTEREILKNFELPRQTSVSQFEKWLNTVRIRFPKIQIEPIAITITK